MRDIPVGNGSLLVTFDDKYQIRDIYFPHVGQENHTAGLPSRFGVWVDGTFSWIGSAGWAVDLKYLHETLVTDVRLVNEDLGLEIVCNDSVASHQNIFLRRIVVRNLFDRPRSVRVFIHLDLSIYENKVGDTAFFDPETKAIVHYQKHRYFLLNTEPHFDEFATGRKAFKGHEGTWRDAEDGELHGGSITEGSVDSTIAVHFTVDPNGSRDFACWLAAGMDYDEVARLDRHVKETDPQEFLNYTENYWRVWVNKNETDLTLLTPEVAELFKRSLLLIHTQIDNDGAILAANDWEVTDRATDHYSYLWTRDGAFVAHALDLAGFSHITRIFFDFCGRIVHPNGYFLQKYNADGTVASGWHSSWDASSGNAMLPIQEDETALVLWALWEHYDRYRDLEFAHRLYRKLVVPCADFMSEFMHPDLGLPKPSWNLWEDRRGIHTFTCASVVAGLNAAARFARLFAQTDRAEGYKSVAEQISAKMRQHLYSTEHGRFLRSLQFHNDENYEPDATIDASMFALFHLGCFPADDEMVANTMSAIENELTVDGGVTRFEDDGYMRNGANSNPWIICTLWLAEYYIARAESAAELEKASRLIQWVVDRALPSGVLAEQIDPETRRPVSVSPLTWSHSTFVATNLNYIKKLRGLAADSAQLK